MENLLKSDEIDNILIICDGLYAEKANDRKGGVGTETLIISPEVYANAKQEKVIPIVWERDNDGNAFLPTYLKDRDYIDFSNDEILEEQYQELILQIYGKAKHKRPELGKTPAFVLDDVPTFQTSKFNLRRLTSSLDSSNIDDICSEFLDNFTNDLNLITLNVSTKKYEDTSSQLISYIEKYDLIRDFFIEFIDKITKIQEVEMTVDSLIDFFVDLEFLSDTNRNCERPDRLFYLFVLKEMFLYTIALGLKNKKYTFIHKIIHSPFYFKGNSYEPGYFVKFNYTQDLINVLNYYINIIPQKNESSPIGELIIERLHKSFKTDMIVDADLICFYITLIYYEKFGDVWEPFTYPYKQAEQVDFIRKLSKKSHFEKVKCIFEVETIEDLKIKFSSLTFDKYTPYSLNKWDCPLPIYESINNEDIGKYPY